MNVDYPSIGKRIKARRRELKKTQEDLAEALSVSVGYISQIERGVTKVSLDTLAEIALRLDCDLPELLSGVTACREEYLDRELNGLCAHMTARQRKMLLEIAEIIAKS